MSEEHDAELKGEKMVALKTASVGVVSKSAKKSCGLTRSAFAHGEIKARSRTSRISLETGNPARIPRDGLEAKCTWRKLGLARGRRENRLGIFNGTSLASDWLLDSSND